MENLQAHNINELLNAIGAGLNVCIYYKVNDTGLLHKVSYETDMDGEKGTFKEYVLMPELNNTMRLTKTIERNRKKDSISLMRKWNKDNFDKVDILGKKEIAKQLKTVNESKSCWKSGSDLGKAIKDGLEVPNCIPDSAYALDEAYAYYSRKNKEVLYKYKKALEWLDEVLDEGDKEYVEKMLKVIERWKKTYESNINNAKNYLKENYYTISAKRDARTIKAKILKSYAFYTEYITNNLGVEADLYLNKLERWKRKHLDLIAKGELEYFVPFSLVEIEEQKIPNLVSILESEHIQKAIRKAIEDEEHLTSIFDDMKGDEYRKKSPEEKAEQLKKIHAHIKKST